MLTCRREVQSVPPKFHQGVYTGRLYRHEKLDVVYHQECASIRGQQPTELPFEKWRDKCPI